MKKTDSQSLSDSINKMLNKIPISKRERFLNDLFNLAKKYAR